MKTQLLREVKGVAVELSLLEATAFIKDPSRVQEEVRTMLKGGGVDVPGYGKTPEESEPETEICPHCLVSFRKLAIHLGKGCSMDPDRVAEKDS